MAEPTQEDNVLIDETLSGNSKSLEVLIKKYQDWIFNVALNFTGDYDQAADLTQEVLIKMVTKLSTFKKESLFKTWLYRIVKNHFLNSQRKQTEENTLTFEIFGQGLDATPDETLSDYSYEVEEKLLVEEAKMSCMKGMLLCLDPEQRMIFILGELFEFTDTLASEIMELSKANFRVKLHRARTQLYNFMQHKCGLINKTNPCRCARKTAGFIKKGFVDPVKLHFQKDILERIDAALGKRLQTFQGEVHESYLALYQGHPMLKNPESASIKEWLSSDKMKEAFDL